MGIKAIDLNPPIGGPGPTATTMPAQNTVCKAFNINRSDTGSVLKVVVPAQSSIYAVSFIANGVSNAATTATATITISDNSGVRYTSTAIDLKANGNTSAPVQIPGLPNLEGQPLNGDLRVACTYAETGTASTSGGPWTVFVHYV